MEYYSIKQVAPILKMDTRQIQRLAERGELPARKVGGEWKFAHPEIVAWLEAKVGQANEMELLDLEDTVQRLSHEVENIPISELIPPGGFQMLRSRSGRGVIHEMVELAMETNLLWDSESMEKAIHEREEMCPTTLEIGAALLHPRRPMTDILGEPFIVLGRTSAGIPFASNGILTDLFFLICSINDTQHLRTLARLSRILNAPEFLSQLRELEDEASVLKLIRETEGNLK